MEREKGFVASQEKRKAKPVYEYESAELRADVTIFPDDVRPIIEKRLTGNPLTPEEDRIFNENRDQWWFEKYGFPHNQTAARQEVLRQKYALPEEVRSGKHAQGEVFKAYREKNSEKIARFKKEYKGLRSEPLEGSVVLFELPAFFEIQKNWKQVMKSAKNGGPYLSRRPNINFCLRISFHTTAAIRNS